MALVARPAFAKSPWSLIDEQPSHRDDVDPGAPTVVNQVTAIGAQLLPDPAVAPVISDQK
jgi:hypothetical protein